MVNSRYESPGTQAPLDVHEGTHTIAPLDPVVGTRPEPLKKLSMAEWSNLANNLNTQINAAISARGSLEANLKSYREAYDMLAGQKDWPFRDSSNLRLPFSAGQLEALVAYICGAVVVPRLFMVQGNTPQAAQNAHLVEKFYNAEFVRLRGDGKSYYQALIDFFHLSLRDGTAYMEILWNRKRTRVPTWMSTPKLDDAGQPVMGENGEPEHEPTLGYADLLEKDYPEWRPVPLKDFLMFPATARTPQEALGNAVAEWLYEDQLNRMVRAGLMDSDEVEAVLRYVPSGNNDVAADRQGSYDKNVSRQIEVGIGIGTQTGKRFRNRGPVKVWRVHTRAYDMNGDDEPEENVFWVHEMSHRLMGWVPYDYAGGVRPFFSGAPLPRPDEALGYSLMERLAGVQMEMDSEHNARQDRRALGLFPVTAIKEGSKLADKGLNFSPGAKNEVESNNPTDPTIAFLNLPDVPISSFQEEALLRQYGTEYTGLSMPAIGAQSSGRRSATEMKQQSQASGTRLGLISMRLRVVIGQMIDFTHKLNKQYLRTPPQTTVGTQVFTLPLEVLMQDYFIGVTGSMDPLDSVTRRQENLAFIQLMMNFPEFQQDAVKRWHLMRLAFEAYNRPDTAQIIGTEEEAKQRQQQMMMQQQQMAAQAQATGQPPPGQQGPPKK